MASVAATHRRPGLIWFDRHPDLNTPASIRDGALDWMVVSHLLALRDTARQVAFAFGDAPLLRPDELVLLATDIEVHTTWEREQVAALGIRAISWQEVAGDPERGARVALESLPDDVDGVAVRFDLDTLDFMDAPLSSAVLRNSGLTLVEAQRALTVLLADPRVKALSISELQPAHTVAGDAVARLIDAVASALAPVPRPGELDDAPLRLSLNGRVSSAGGRQRRGSSRWCRTSSTR